MLPVLQLRLIIESCWIGKWTPVFHNVSQVFRPAFELGIQQIHLANDTVGLSWTDRLLLQAYSCPKRINDTTGRSTVWDCPWDCSLWLSCLENGPGGQAYGNRVYTRWGAAVVRPWGWDWDTHIFAHEIGHCLGLKHDLTGHTVMSYISMANYTHPKPEFPWHFTEEEYTYLRERVKHRTKQIIHTRDQRNMSATVSF